MKSPESKAKHAAYMRQFRRTHPEEAKKHLVHAQKWYAKNRELKRASDAERYRKNPLAVIERARQFKKTAKGKAGINRYQKKRYQQRKNAIGVATPAQLNARSAFYGHQCYLCRAPAKMMDHVIPMKERPIAWPANRRPICNRCNGRKAGYSLREYLLRAMSSAWSQPPWGTQRSSKPKMPSLRPNG